jgi:hypothetical protein
MKTTSIISTIAALVAVAVLGASAVSAVTESSYRAALESAGTKTSVEVDRVTHVGMKGVGKVIVIERDGKVAKVELIEYADGAKLREDWTVVNGESPKPKFAAADFAGKILYWNNDAVLAVSFAAPNDPALARAAGDAFLGRSVQQPGSPTATPVTGGTPPVKAPNAGSSGYKDAGSGSDALAALTLGLAAIVLVGFASLHMGMRRR